MSAILMGIGDEAGAAIDSQTAATRELGWDQIEMRGVEVPGFPKANFHELSDKAFDAAAGRFSDAGISVYCFGSTIMNWAKTLETPWEITLGEVKRAIPRMQRLGTQFVRIMSLKPREEEYKIPNEVFRRVREVTTMFLDAGLTPLHENCMNYGGMSCQHALELLDRAPGLKWVFYSANPVFNPDRSKPKPWPQQDPWEFWVNVRQHVSHIHVKDATWNSAKNDADYNWPGEGQARVRDILKDALSRGYTAGISIEPHMVVVFHDAQSKASDSTTRANFVEYGKRLASLISELEPRLGPS